MSVRGAAVWVRYWTIDQFNMPLAGDIANHTISFFRDGTVTAATNSQVAGSHKEISGGRYAILMTAAEADCDSWSVQGTTTTSLAKILGEEGFTEQAVNVTFDSSIVTLTSETS